MDGNGKRPVYYNVKVNCGCGFTETINSEVSPLGAMVVGKMFKAAMDHINQTGHALDVLGTMSPVKLEAPINVSAR